MWAALVECAICLALGAAAAWFTTSTTGAFLIVLTVVTFGVWIVIRFARRKGRKEWAAFTFADLLDFLFFWL